MGFRKYADDYRLENVPDGRGKLKTVPVYAGAQFRFLADASRIRRLRVLFPVCWAVASAAWLAVMTMNLRPARLAWCVLLPFVGAALCLFFEGCGVYRLLTAGKQVTREHHDKLYSRIAGASVCHMISGALAIAGSVAILCRNPFAPMYAVVLGCCVVYTACGVVMFLRRGGLRMEQILPKTEDAPPEQ